MAIRNRLLYSAHLAHDMTPTLSIILPVYNGAAYLPAALDSLTRQTALDQLEIIVLDDGSTDGSLDLVRAYAPRLPLTVAPNIRSGNWVTNTNRGLALARGRYVCFLHQDDLWLEGRMAWILDALRRHPDCPVLFSAANYLDPHHQTAGRWTAPFAGNREQVLAPMDWFCPLLVQNYIAIPAPVFRRDLITSAQPLDESLPYAADWKWWLTLARRHPACYRPQPTVGFRVHPESQTVNLTSDPEAYRLQLQGVYAAFAPGAPDTPQGRRWQAAAELGLVANATMAALFHRQRPPWGRFFQALGRAGMRGGLLYVKASRLRERLAARLRILLRPR